jgi:proteasome assembly chaperone (PAC2) family protein
MDHLVELYRPELRDPIMLAAFAGWNDAAEVATGSLRYLTRHWRAEQCAEIDPEEFFVFTDTRPQVRVVDNLQRRITWPQNQFYHARPPDSSRDILLLIGTEPNLRWKTFTQTILDYAAGLGVTLVINLGGLLADVLHSRPAVITGSIADPALARKVAGLGIHRSRYEGPTGIVGVLGDVCRQRGVVAGSIWGNVPHYIGSMTNPAVSAALLSTVGELLDLKIDLSELNRAAIRFNAQVSTAIADDSDVAAYIRQLEERERQKAEEESRTREELPPPSELPSPDVVVRELEEFLRRSKEGDAD